MQTLAKSAPLAILLCAAAYLFARTLQFDFPRAPGRLGPDVWPQAILILLMAACVAGMARNVLLARAGREAEQVDLLGDARGVAPRYGLVAAGALLFLGYPLALQYLGFPAATFLLMALFMWVGQWRNPLGVLAVSAVGTFALFYIFRGVVYVSLPLGRGPFHDATVWFAAVLGMR